MDEESFRRKLISSFTEKGLPDSLKLHLRNSLVKSLKNDQLEGKFRKGLDEKNLCQKITDRLVYRHLYKSGYHYTLSLFGPECGLDTGAELSSSLEDVLQLLNVVPGSLAFKRIKEAIHQENHTSGHDGKSVSKSDLWIVIKCLMRCFNVEVDGDHANVISTAVQTGNSVYDKASALTFSEKLRAVDEEYENRERMNEVTLSERLSLIRREMEARYEEQLNAELNRIRDNEIAKTRLEFEEKCRAEVSLLKAQLENKYEERLMILQKREEANMESVRVKMKTMEKEAYTKRQNLLEQIESLRRREVALNRQADMQQRNFSLEEGKMSEREKKLDTREKMLTELESNYECKLYQSEVRIREEIKNEYKTRMDALEREEKSVEQIKSSIEKSADKLKKLTQIELSMEQLKVELESMKRQNEINEERLEEMSDYHRIKQDNILLKEEVDQLKNNLDDIININTNRQPNSERQLFSKAISEQGHSLMGDGTSRYPTARSGLNAYSRSMAAGTAASVVPRLDIGGNQYRQDQNVQTAAIVKQMATELAQLKLQLSLSKNSQQAPSVPPESNPLIANIADIESSNIHTGVPNVGPVNTMNNLHNDSLLLDDNIPDISTTSSTGEEEFLSSRRVLGKHSRPTTSTIYGKQNEAMSFGGLQFLADSRSKMQNLSQEADHLDTRYKSYSQRLSMLAQETYKLPSSSSADVSPRTEKTTKTDFYPPHVVPKETTPEERDGATPVPSPYHQLPSSSQKSVNETRKSAKNADGNKDSKFDVEKARFDLTALKKIEEALGDDHTVSPLPSSPVERKFMSPQQVITSKRADDVPAEDDVGTSHVAATYNPNEYTDFDIDYKKKDYSNNGRSAAIESTTPNLAVSVGPTSRPSVDDYNADIIERELGLIGDSNEVLSSHVQEILEDSDSDENNEPPIANVPNKPTKSDSPRLQTSDFPEVKEKAYEGGNSAAVGGKDETDLPKPRASFRTMFSYSEDMEQDKNKHGAKADFFSDSEDEKKTKTSGRFMAAGDSDQYLEQYAGGGDDDDDEFSQLVAVEAPQSPIGFQTSKGQRSTNDSDEVSF